MNKYFRNGFPVEYFDGAETMVLRSDRYQKAAFELIDRNEHLADRLLDNPVSTINYSIRNIVAVTLSSLLDIGYHVDDDLRRDVEYLVRFQLLRPEHLHDPQLIRNDVRKRRYRDTVLQRFGITRRTLVYGDEKYNDAAYLSMSRGPIFSIDFGHDRVAFTAALSKEQVEQVADAQDAVYRWTANIVEWMAGDNLKDLYQVSIYMCSISPHY
jgi:hypothetical protein